MFLEEIVGYRWSIKLYFIPKTNIFTSYLDWMEHFSNIKIILLRGRLFNFNFCKLIYLYQSTIKRVLGNKVKLISSAAFQTHSQFIINILFVNLTVIIRQLYKMSSPPRAQKQIEHQIKKRIIPDALTPNDLDFYTRKVRRLQSDNNVLQDQLNKVRIKLRRAEDYQIKYEALMGENVNIKKQLEIREKSLRDLKSENQKIARSAQDRKDKTQEWNAEKQRLLQDIDKWTRKTEDSEIRRVTELAAERLKNQDSIKREVSQMKKDFDQKEDELKFTIRQLQKVIHEKETVENIINNRVQKIRREKDEEITRLGHIIEDQKQAINKSAQQKNQQIDRLKDKFEKMINFQIENIKKNLEDQGEIFTIELNGLKEIISIKNDEITKLLGQIKRQAIQHEENRKEMLGDISNLKDKIYEIQREGELELYNLRQKLMDIHAADLQAIEARYQQLINSLRNDKLQLENFLKEMEKQREGDRKDYQRTVNELTDKIKERDQRISSLLSRIKDSGDLNSDELKNLHLSFHKIEAQKEGISSEYQKNITFMTQQISKLTAANEIKNNQLKKLFDEMQATKYKYEDEIRSLLQKNKKDRRQREEERERDRKQAEKILQNQAVMERQFKNSEKQLQREKDKEEREKNKLAFMVEQLERDVGRLNKYIKQLDDSLKQEFKKNQINILESGGSRRELTSQIEKQKVQIQTFWSIEIDQMKRKYEIDTSRLIQENQKLKTDMLNKSLALQKAETELKKIDYQHRNLDKISKQKILDYQKKMATLNSEINLTQQLYQSFMQAKSRKK